MKLKDNFTYSFSILTFEKYSFLVLVKKKPPTRDGENLKKEKKKDACDADQGRLLGFCRIQQGVKWF